MRTLTSALLGLTILIGGLLGAGPPEGGTGIPGLQLTPPPPAFNDSRDRVRVSVTPSRDAVAAGTDLVLAIVFDHDAGWHVYAADADLPGDLFPTVIDVTAEDGSPLKPHPGYVQWPKSKELLWFGETYAVYDGRAVAFVVVTVASDASPGTHTLMVKAGFQACDDMLCLMQTPYPARAGEPASPEWADYGIPVEIRVVPPAEAGGGMGADADLFDGFDAAVIDLIRKGIKPPTLKTFDLFGWSFTINVAGVGGFVLLLLVAAVGGFLLNLTPCVLPIIPLKIMGLSSAAGNRGKTLRLGTVMSAGVVALWLGIGLGIALVGGFTSSNQLLQYPVITIMLGVFIAAMAIGMCGLFSIRLPQFVYGINPTHETYRGSFVFGIMTGVLSTPCTAPFMGVAAAYAATLAPAKTLIIFAAIGIGMALPYQVLSAFPQLVERMPRTGPASELIKQVMGLLMLAAAAYFAGTGVSGLLADPPQPPGRMYLWVVAAFGVAAGAWMMWRTFKITPGVGRRVTFGGLGVVIVAASTWIGVRLSDRGPIDWVYYTPEQFDAAKDRGEVVVMEFTAEWCLNCKALERTALANDRVVALLEGEGVVPIKVDLTGGNAPGNAMLNAVDRVTIPLLVVFAPDGTETFKSAFYTSDQVIKAVEQAGVSEVAAVP